MKMCDNHWEHKLFQVLEGYGAVPKVSEKLVVLFVGLGLGEKVNSAMVSIFIYEPVGVASGGGIWGGTHLLHQSRQFGWPRHLLGIQQKQRLLCWYIDVCLTFQDSQLADFGLGGVYGSIPLRFRKKAAWDTIETPCFHDLWISGHLLGHLNHQELCLVNRICSNTTPNDL